MPQNLTDVSTFSDPVVAPIDGDTLDTASIVDTSIQSLANRTRYLANLLGTITGLSEWIYTAPRTRVRTISPLAMTQGTLATGTGQVWTIANFTSGGTARSRTSQVNNALLADDVSRYLPIGATLTGVEVMVAPGVARASSGNRITVTLSRMTPDWGAPVIPATVDVFSVTDDGSTAVQVIDSGVISENISRSVQHVLRIQAGNDAGTNKDDIHAIRLSFTVLGPNAF